MHDDKAFAIPLSAGYANLPIQHNIDIICRSAFGKNRIPVFEGGFLSVRSQKPDLFRGQDREQQFVACPRS